MDKKISDALDALGTAADAELAKLSTIEDELRTAGGLSDADASAIADRIAGVTAKLTAAVNDTSAAAGGTDTSGSGGAAPPPPPPPPAQ